MDQDLLEKIRNSLPPYLSAQSKRELLEQLADYTRNRDYYGIVPGETEPLQGDAWRGLITLDFATAERDSVVGLVISNSCDITAQNQPNPDQQMLFAPVLDLERYAHFLEVAGKTAQQITDTLGDIRGQAIHRLFYLPAMHGVFGESLVALDAIHAQPLSSIDAQRIQRVFSLNTYGWYVLLIKLSIHFTRMTERLERRSLPAA
jgi:hypothetical protein